MNDPVALATLATVVLMGLDKLSNKFSFNLCSGLGLKTCAMKCSQCCEIDMNMRSGNYSRAFRNTTLNNPILPIIQKTLDPVPIESSIQQHTAPLDLKDIILLNNQTAGEKPILLSHLSNPSNHSNRSNRSNHTQVDTHIPDRSLPSRQSSFASQPDEIDWHSFDPSKKKIESILLLKMGKSIGTIKMLILMQTHQMHHHMERDLHLYIQFIQLLYQVSQIISII